MDGIAVDAIGNLYIAADGYESGSDSYNITIRKMTPDGVIRIVYSARDTGCDAPLASTVDASGNIYIFYGG